jgi:hypothetical protein
LLTPLSDNGTESEPINERDFDPPSINSTSGLALELIPD